MAIIYYTDYKAASERHLETCLQIKEILEQQFQPKTLLSAREAKEQEQLLSNLYYLSGYVIECIYNYAIFKNISFPSNVDVADLKYNSGGLPRYPVLCNVAFRSNQHTPTGTFIIAGAIGHKLFGHMGFFQTHFIHTGASSIPLLNNQPLIRHCDTLFQAWDVYSRYKIDGSISLNCINTFDFFDLSVEVYEGIINHL